MQQELEMPSYTISQAEKLAQLPKNRLYKLISSGIVEATRDVNGQLRVSYEELSHYINTNRKDQ